MRKCNLKDFKKGWFLGNFEPTLFDTDIFEVSVKRYLAGDKEDSHYHLIATEYTVIIEGIAKMNDMVVEKDEIVIVEPGTKVSFEALTDVCTVVVKTPSVKNDKYTE
jgi:hypothetical protein